MKKATGRKVSSKSEKGEMGKKIVASLRSPEKITAKGKTAVKASTPKRAKKSTSQKSKSSVSAKGTAKNLKVKTKQRKTEKRTTAKKGVSPLKSRKAGTEKKVEKKSRVKVAAKTEEKVSKRRLPKKVTKPVRKTAQKKTKMVEVAKPVKRPLKKPRAKPAAKKAEVSAGMKAVKKVRPVRKAERVTRARKPIKEMETVELIKRPGRVKAVKEVTQVKSEKKVKVRPSPEPKHAPAPRETLPAEYGENDVTLMVVNPHKLFTFWEIREDTLEIFKGKLVVRLYDITGIDLEEAQANSFADIEVSERIGKEYIHADPKREYIADIGIIYDGTFITIARSQKISTPGEGVPEEALALYEIYETDLRIGY